MDRLLLTSMAALVAGICAVNVEAQVASPAQAAGASYTIAGDVQDPGLCRFPANQRVTVRDLLNYIGARKSKGNALILRGQPLSFVMGENFTPDANGSGDALIPGDIVIFRRLATWQSPNQNVVVVTSDGTQALNFDLNTRIPVGQLPGVSQSSRGVTVIRTSEFGVPKTAVLQPTDFVQHGDVVQVDLPAPGGLRVAENAPAAAAPAEFALAIPDQSTGQEPSASSSMGGPGLTIPGMNDAQIESPDEFSPFELTESADTEQTDDGLFRTASFQSGTETQTSGSVADEIVAATPLAGAESESSNALWNVLFVLGLVFALGLIVIGWVKTQQERQHELDSAKQMQVGLSNTALTESSSIKQNSVADKLDEEEILQTLNSSSDSEATTQEIELTAADIEPAVDLTDELWVETETEAAAKIPETTEDAFVDDDCPILSAGFDTLAAAEQATGVSSESAAGIETLGAQVGFSTQEAVTEDNKTNSDLVANTAANALVGSDEWFGADWRTSVTESVTADVGESIEEIPATDKATVFEEVAAESLTEDSLSDEDDDDMDVDDTVVELRESWSSQKRASSIEAVADESDESEEDVIEASDSRSDLEDLIHNRLPMELKQVDLPLQVSLFGRPSGPKRLRIDNAHTQIAAPHMMSGARRNRRPEKMAVAAEQTKPLESEDRSSGGPVEQGRGTPGLDKALNFIDERSDS